MWARKIQEKAKGKVSLVKICKELRVNRSSYYDWLKRPIAPRVKANLDLIEDLRAQHKKSYGRYGAPRLTIELRKLGYLVNQKRIANLMRKIGIFGCARRKFRPMDSKNTQLCASVAPRIFKIEEKESLPKSPSQVWVSDMTYIETGEGWLFLTTVMDLYHRQIIGYTMMDHQRPEATWEAVRLAIADEDTALSLQCPDLLIHSDRGGQYSSEYYREKLKGLGITQSMSRSGNCYDNAYAEGFFRTLKVELIYRNKYQTRSEAQLAITEYIDWYNTKRLHSSLGYQTPFEYGKKALAA